MDGIRRWWFRCRICDGYHNLGPATMIGFEPGDDWVFCTVDQEQKAYYSADKFFRATEEGLQG